MFVRAKRVHFFFLLTSYSTAPRVISSCMDNVKLELEKRKVVCGAEVIKKGVDNRKDGRLIT